MRYFKECLVYRSLVYDRVEGSEIEKELFNFNFGKFFSIKG